MPSQRVDQIMSFFTTLQRTENWKVVRELMVADPERVRMALIQESDDPEAMDATAGEIVTAIHRAQALVESLKPLHEALQGESLNETHRRAGLVYPFKDRRD